MRKVYQLMPKPLKQAVKLVAGRIPLRWRMGARFRNELAALERSQWWPREQLEQVQDEKLRALVRHAVENVPYYQHLFHELGLRPEDIRGRGDLEKIPLLAKDTLRERPDEFIARNIPAEQRVRIKTSGTTGRSVTLYSELRNEHLYGGPFEWRLFRWGGCQPGDRMAIFRAHFGAPGSESVYSFNPAQNKLYFSTYQLSESTLAQFAGALGRYQPRFFQGWPSALGMLASLLRESGMARPVQPRAIYTVGELVQPRQRQLIEGYFDCPILDWYGMEERALLATQCGHSPYHHLNPEYCICELQEDNSLEVGIGKVIATGLTNYASPLIRYDTGDLASPIDESCPCGRQFPLIRIIGGRSRQVLIDREGRPIPEISGIINHMGECIRQHQFYQEQPGRVIMRIVPGQDFTEASRIRLREGVTRALAGRIEVEFEYVDAIPMTGAGKIPLVVSKISCN